MEDVRTFIDGELEKVAGIPQLSRGTKAALGVGAALTPIGIYKGFKALKKESLKRQAAMPPEQKAEYNRQAKEGEERGRSLRKKVLRKVGIGEKEKVAISAKPVRSALAGRHFWRPHKKKTQAQVERMKELATELKGRAKSERRRAELSSIEAALETARTRGPRVRKALGHK
jgi:hypothetical protein